MTRTAFLRIFCAFATLSGLAPSVLAPASAQHFSRGGDQDRARDEAGDRRAALPFRTLKQKVEAEMADEASYVGVAPPSREGVVRMQFLRKDGRVIWVDVDARTGDIIARTR